MNINQAKNYIKDSILFASITMVLSCENATNPDLIRLDNNLVTSTAGNYNLSSIL